jgi:hypothetical protein
MLCSCSGRNLPVANAEIKASGYEDMFKRALTPPGRNRSFARMAAKDWLVEKAGMALLNQAVLKPYGTLTRLKLDTAARTIEGDLELHGETQPVNLQVREYELREADGRATVVLKDIRTSREWLTTLMKNFVVDREFSLPDSVKKFLPMIR